MMLTNYPNPFNGRTTIEMNLPPGAKTVTLSLVNVLGQVIDDRTLSASSRLRYSYDASQLSTGTYMLRAQAGGIQATRKIVVLK
jgi:hypothetical protein